MARIRADYVFGTTTNDPLLIGDTSLSSAELASLPAVATGDVAAVTLYDGTDFEILYVTASAAGATTRPVLRGREGTAAREWPSGSTWHLGVTAADFDNAFAPAAGRPSRLVPAGVKLRGANIVPMDSAGNPWATLYAGWSTKWDTIVKPQIDAAASVGANAIRLIGDVGGVHTGTLTVDAYVAAYEQFVDYCANLGLHVYACLSASQHWSGATKDQALTVMTAQAAMLEGKSNVLGIDVVQELGLVPALWSGSTQHDFVSYLFDAIRAVTTLPLTCSVLGSDNSSAAQWSTSTTAAFADLVDFYDFHPYYTGMTAADLAPFIAANSAGKPLLLGEYGGTSTDTSVHQAGAAVSALPEVVGSFIWSIADNDVSSDWGLFDTTFTERTALTNIFRTVPDREEFAAGGHIVEDEGATLPARARLNFVGAGVVVEDDAANDATKVTVAGSTPGSGAFTPTHHKIRTSGHLTINNTAWADLDTTLDLTVPAVTGDTIEVSLSGYIVPNSNAQYASLDAVTVVGGSAVTSFSSNSGTPASGGVTAWMITGPAEDHGIGGSVMLTVGSGDISGGNVTVRLRYKTNNAVNHTVRASTSEPLKWSLKNLGQ